MAHDGENKCHAKHIHLCHADKMTFNKFLTEVSNRQWVYANLVSYIKEMSPRCFWVMPDYLVIKRVNVEGLYFVEKHKIAALMLPNVPRMNFPKMLMTYGVRIENTSDTKIVDGFLDIANGSFPYLVDKVDEKLIEPILTFILEVWANSNVQTYINILNWLRNIFTGRNSTVLLLCSDKPQCGKKFLLNWMRKYIFWDDFAVTYDAQKVFARKKMIVISRKTMIDDETFDKISFAASSDMVDELKNRSNFVITTCNKNILDDVRGRNVTLACVSSKCANDKKYFDDLWGKIANYIVADHFYSFLMSYEPAQLWAQTTKTTNNKF